MILYILDWHGTVDTLPDPKGFLEALHAKGYLTIGCSSDDRVPLMRWATFGNMDLNDILDCFSPEPWISLDDPQTGKPFDLSVVSEIVVSDDAFSGVGGGVARLWSRKTNRKVRLVDPKDLLAEVQS